MNDENGIIGHKIDHDLLIRIDTKLSLLMESFSVHTREDAARFALIEKDIRSAHNRMDWMVSGVGLSVIGLIVTILKLFFIK